MNSVDLQTRKLSIIEYLIHLDDSKFISKIENIVDKSKSFYSSKLTSLTKRELIKRAQKSNDEINAGKVLSQKKVEEKSGNWY